MHVGIVHTPHDDGDCSSCIFGHLNGLGSVGDDHGNWQSDQFRGKLPQSLGPTVLWPTVFDDEGSSLDMAKIAQSLPEFIDELFCAGPCNPQDTNSWYVGLLRTGRKRPRGDRAAEQGDELAPPNHSITSSAATSSLSGTVRLSALAVLRLMVSSNLVCRSTGSSPGLAPLRIRPA